MEQKTVGNDSEKNRSSPVDGLSSSSVAQSGISGSRRRFSRLSLGAAPIVISLVSKPVLGAQCLSNMMSGNLSNPNRGNCSKGWSPGGWGQPGGDLGPYSTTPAAWQAAGYLFGNLLTPSSNPNQLNSYTGGDTVAQAGLTGLLPSSGANKLLRDVVIDTGNQTDRHVLTAWLNASISGKLNFTYILTKQQVMDLANGTLPVPGSISLTAFLASTWT